MQPIQFFFVGIGGFLGANARYFLSDWIMEHVAASVGGRAFPFGTIFVNVIGSFLLAIFIVWTTEHMQLSENNRLLIATGFFGAFTTFSTYANESIALIQDGDWVNGLGYIFVTNSLCLFGVVLGIWLMGRIPQG